MVFALSGRGAMAKETNRGLSCLGSVVLHVGKRMESCGDFGLAQIKG